MYSQSGGISAEEGTARIKIILIAIVVLMIGILVWAIYTVLHAQYLHSIGRYERTEDLVHIILPPKPATHSAQLVPDTLISSFSAMMHLEDKNGRQFAFIGTATNAALSSVTLSKDGVSVTIYFSKQTQTVNLPNGIYDVALPPAPIPFISSSVRTGNSYTVSGIIDEGKPIARMIYQTPKKIQYNQ